MTVQEAGGDVVALCVDDLCVLTDAVSHIAHSSDGIAADSDTAVVDLAGVDVYDLAVIYDQISGLEALCDCQKFFHNVPPNVFVFIFSLLINY